jgi:hypothetical protein
MNDSLTDLWAQQHRDAAPPTAAELARAGARLRRRVLLRDTTEYAAGLIAAAIFVRMAAQSTDWDVRIACAAIVLGTGITMWNLWRRRPRAPEAALGVSALDFHRGQLVAQRDALASVWRWYLAPPLPGMILLLLARGRGATEHMPLWSAVAVCALSALVVAGVFWGIHRLNRAAAARVQRAIDALDRGEI